jgi:hypothetical protein
MSLILGYISFADKLAVFLWIILFFGVVVQLIPTLISIGMQKKYLQNTVAFVIHKQKYLVWFIIFLFIVWNSFQSLYYLGGDDTRLYYLYPWDYFINYASKTGKDIAISNVSTFLPPRSIAPFVLLLSFVKTILPFINLQGLFYSLNIIFGVYFFYRFTLYITKDKALYSKNIFFISSCMYVFSIFNFYTLFNSQLMAIYLISIFPFFLYIFTKSIYEKKIYLLLPVAIVFTVFGVTSVSSFWFVATLITVLPLLVYISVPHFRRFVGYGFVLAALLLLCNIYWLVYLPQTTLVDKSANAVNSVVSQDFLLENANGVRSTSEINSLFYPLLNLYHRQIQINFNWPYLPIFQSWYFILLPFNIFFISAVFIAGFYMSPSSKKTFLYVASAFSFIISLYLFTVNVGSLTIGNPGISLYVWMVNHIPGFVVFRNMYDKFGHAMAFTFAFLIGMSSLIILQKWKDIKFHKIYIACFGVLVVLQSVPFLTNRFNTIPVWTTSHVFQGITSFNDDYQNLAEYIGKQNESGRYLVLPLSTGNVIPIADGNLPNHYYVGVSPLLILSGKNDYSGFLSFGTDEKPIKDAVINHDFDSIDSILRRGSVSYVIVNKDIPEELAHGYMYPDGIFDIEDEEFQSHFLGEKIKDFGNRYSLYRLRI